MKTIDREIDRLRERAQAVMSSGAETSANVPEGMRDALRLVEELRVYQTELEIQNQDLRSAQMQAEGAMRKYRRMFENLPLEALLVDGQGFITEANSVARKRFGLHRSTALQRRSAYQLFAFDSRATLHAALGQGLDVDRASKCKLLADAQGVSPEVDVHIITVDPTSLLDDERMLLMVNRTPEADAEAQTAASKPGEPPLP